MMQILLLALLLMLVACGRPESSRAHDLPEASAQVGGAASVPDHMAKVAARRNRDRTYDVVPYGYNYTDTYIDSFEVNGHGGGNLSVSTPTSGGGGSACCMGLRSGTPAGAEFTVKWTRDRKRWCEQKVRLSTVVPADALYFEVHFYQDGHIEVAATQSPSEPRLKLAAFDRGHRHLKGNVNNDERFSTCKESYD